MRKPRDLAEEALFEEMRAMGLNPEDATLSEMVEDIATGLTTFNPPDKETLERFRMHNHSSIYSDFPGNINFRRKD